MKKVIILLFCVALFSSCSSPSEVSPTVGPTITSLPTEKPTRTPITPTSTFTVTPTLVGQKTKTATPNLDLTPTQVSVTPLLLITPNTLTPKPEMKGFVTVNVSGSEFYTKAECQPASIKFTAQVTDVVNTAFVLLFVRLKSKQTGNTSPWADYIDMESLGAGTFVHDLIADEIKAVDSYSNPWVQYQFVALDSDTNKIGSTDIFSERLTLLECEFTPTLTPSPTALKP